MRGRQHCPPNLVFSCSYPNLQLSAILLLNGEKCRLKKRAGSTHQSSDENEHASCQHETRQQIHSIRFTKNTAAYYNPRFYLEPAAERIEVADVEVADVEVADVEMADVCLTPFAVRAFMNWLMWRWLFSMGIFQKQLLWGWLRV